MLSSEDEFEKAFEILSLHPRRITFFGSARTKFDDKYAVLARNLAANLAKDGWAIVTGGGGGIMNAANEGAYQSGGISIGFNIHLPHEQTLNSNTTEHLEFNYFFTRKVMMTFYSHAYIYFPGGFGTLDEFFEVLTLMQTNKMPKAPLILVGNEFWGNLEHFIEENQLKTGLISPGDQKIYTISEDIEVISEMIGSSAKESISQPANLVEIRKLRHWLRRR